MRLVLHNSQQYMHYPSDIKSLLKIGNQTRNLQLGVGQRELSLLSVEMDVLNGSSHRSKRASSTAGSGRTAGEG